MTEPKGMELLLYNFGDIVVVGGSLVGVVVKSWGPNNRTGLYSHEVYVRSLNCIKEYPQEEIMRLIYDKELSDEQLEYYLP